MKTVALFDNYFFENKSWWLPAKLHRAICNRANPRTKKYMESLLKKQFPETKLYLRNEIDSLDYTDHLVLLYPDSIGLGWGIIEKKCRNMCNNITILNGRSRSFSLDQKTIIELKMKRFLETSFLLELVISPFLIIYGALLAINDKFFESTKS